MEVLKQKVEYGDELRLKYEDLTIWEGQEVMLKNISDNEKKIGWWYYMQIRNLFMADKRTVGLMKQYTEIDKILLGEKTKIISKIYNVIYSR